MSVRVYDSLALVKKQTVWEASRKPCKPQSNILTRYLVLRRVLIKSIAFGNISACWAEAYFPRPQAQDQRKLHAFEDTSLKRRGVSGRPAVQPSTSIVKDRNNDVKLRLTKT